MPIDGGESDVERLARGGEVYFEPPVAIRPFKRLLQEPPRRFADGRGLIVREKAVAVELDENPLRPAANADAGAAPSAQAFGRERISWPSKRRHQFAAQAIRAVAGPNRRPAGRSTEPAHVIFAPTRRFFPVQCGTGSSSGRPH